MFEQLLVFQSEVQQITELIFQIYIYIVQICRWCFWVLALLSSVKSGLVIHIFALCWSHFLENSSSCFNGVQQKLFSNWQLDCHVMSWPYGDGGCKLARPPCQPVVLPGHVSSWQVGTTFGPHRRCRCHRRCCCCCSTDETNTMPTRVPLCACETKQHPLDLLARLRRAWLKWWKSVIHKGNLANY